MKKLYKIVSIILVILILIALIGYFSFKNFLSLSKQVDKLPQNEDAIKVMSDTEKSYLNNKFLKVKEGMSGNEVENVLGKRYKMGVTDSLAVTGAKRRIDQWLCPEWSSIGSSNQYDCIIQVYFVDDKAVGIKWLRLEHFFYEIKWIGY
jgi:hypothetical protein